MNTIKVLKIAGIGLSLLTGVIEMTLTNQRIDEQVEKRVNEQLPKILGEVIAKKAEEMIANN